MPGSSRNVIQDQIFFFLFLGLSHPGLDRNDAGMMFFNFSNFFAIFFGNFLTRVGSERNSGLKLFSLSLGLFHPGLERNNAGMMFFFIFRIVLLIFLEFSCSGRVRKKFRTKIFFSLFLGQSHPGLDRNNSRMIILNFLNFFAFFLEFPSQGRVGTEFGTKIFFSLSQPISSWFG